MAGEVSSRRRFRDSGGPPPRPLVVGAIAVADRRANAVGLVRLVCQPDGLRIDLLQVGRFSAGFTFAGLADAVSFRVPYTAVRGMVRDGTTLHLSLDERAAAPYSRFALARFNHDPLSAMMRAYRLRALAAAFSLAVPLPLAAAAVWAVPGQYVGGAVGLGAMALVVAWVAYQLLRRLVSWLTWGGPLSDRLRERFEHAVAVKLGLEPAPAQVSGPLLAPPPPRAEPASALAALGVVVRPRRFGLVGALALTMGLAAVLVVQRYGVAAIVTLPVDDAASGVTAPVDGLLTAAHRAVTPEHPGCECSRVDSVLWRTGVPELAILVEPIEGEMDQLWLEPAATYPIRFAADGEERARVELDVAVVNNADRELDTVDLVLTFARRDAGGERRNLIERGLHWPGKLGPGEAVKWRVKASGTEVKADARLNRKLGEAGLTAAPADSFEALAAARLPIVRLHGAMMLGYLGDPRALERARALGVLTPPQERARAEILASMSPMAVCDPRPAATGLELCVRNGSGVLHRGVVVTELGSEGKRHVFRDLFFPGRGLRVKVAVNPGDSPPGFAVEPLDLAPPP